MQAKKIIKEVAKANVKLLDEVKDAKDFAKLFNRNFAKRVNEHMTLIGDIVRNIEVVDAYNNSLYSALSENISKATIKTLVERQLQSELNRKQNFKLLEKHVNLVSEMFNVCKLFESAFKLNEQKKFEVASVIRTKLNEAFANEKTKTEDIKKILREYQESVASALAILTEVTIRKVNSDAITVSDLGELAATTLRGLQKESSEKKAISWWNDSLLLKENNFRNVKNVLLGFQQVLLSTESEIPKFMNEVKTMTFSRSPERKR